MILLALHRGNPTVVLIGIAIELAIAKIASEQAELPHVIGDVFADVTNRTVGADDDFLIFLRNLLGLLGVSFVLCCEGSTGAAHHPTAPVLAFSLVSEDARLFQLAEGRIPEVQVQDLAFARQEIVFDLEAVHGFEVATQYCGRDQLGDCRSFAAGIFDRMKRFAAGLQMFFVLLIPLRDTGVEIPTVVIEARPSGEGFDFRARFVLAVSEPHDHVGHLHTGVVNVVLYVDFPACIAQQPDKRIAKNSVAQMADVGSLVGIDTRVFDQNLSRGNIRRRLLVGGELGCHPGPIDSHVQIARRSDLHFGNAFDGADFRTDDFGNPQWRSTQRLGERKNRNGKIPKLYLGRLLDYNFRQRSARVSLAKKLQQTLSKTVFQITIQRVPLRC